MEKIHTKEPQYQCVLEASDKFGAPTLGLMSGYTWITDPKRLLFLLARYKFVAKCFSGLEKVLEIGCADAFGTRIVRQEVKSLTATDFDPVFIEHAQTATVPPPDFQLKVHDILSGPLEEGNFDGVFSLDVIEHIPKEQEDIFLKNILKSMHQHGTLIIGTPTIYSQVYASAASKEGHVNCKDHHELKALLAKYFHNVFIFSMNDEIVHTGFYQMAHYFMAVCCSPRLS